MNNVHLLLETPAFYHFMHSYEVTQTQCVLRPLTNSISLFIALRVTPINNKYSWTPKIEFDLIRYIGTNANWLQLLTACVSSDEDVIKRFEENLKRHDCAHALLKLYSYGIIHKRCLPIFLLSNNRPSPCYRYYILRLAPNDFFYNLLPPLWCNVIYEWK